MFVTEGKQKRWGGVSLFEGGLRQSAKSLDFYDKKAAVLAVAKHTVFKQDKMNGAQVRIPTLQMITPNNLQHFLGAVQCLYWS